MLHSGKKRRQIATIYATIDESFNVNMDDLVKFGPAK